MKFQDPPESKSRKQPKVSYEDQAAIKANPGKWALAAEGVGSAAAGNYKRLGFEATTRVRPDRKFDLYLRWPVSADA